MKTEEILNEREKTHGGYAAVCAAWCGLTAEFDEHYEASEVVLNDEQASAIKMILLKLARIVCGDPNHEDHWDDIAGYAMLGKGKRVIRQEDMPPTAHVGEKFLFEGGKFGPVDEKQWSRDCGHSPVMRTYSKASEVEKGVRTTCFFWICNDCGHLYIHDIKQNNVDISKMETTE